MNSRISATPLIVGRPDVAIPSAHHTKRPILTGKAKQHLAGRALNFTKALNRMYNRVQRSNAELERRINAIGGPAEEFRRGNGDC
jgi:hypothetical protein